MKRLLVILGVGWLTAAFLQGCERAEPAVSYEKEVRPLLVRRCVDCHSKAKQGEGFVKTGLSMDSYESLMRGTKFGAVVKPGDSFTSVLVMLVEGRADPSIKMPHGDKEGLSQTEIDTLRKWIDQGAKNN